MQSSYPTTTTPTNGMSCPICTHFIPIHFQQLLHDNGVQCPHCGLSMTINRAQSKLALDALAKVEAAIQNVRKTETFKL